ncbi:unnamed protein product, partial [Ectocarpus sp. 13 AM-2016]
GLPLVLGGGGGIAANSIAGPLPLGLMGDGFRNGLRNGLPLGPSQPTAIISGVLGLVNPPIAARAALAVGRSGPAVAIAVVVTVGCVFRLQEWCWRISRFGRGLSWYRRPLARLTARRGDLLPWPRTIATAPARLHLQVALPVFLG